MTSGEKASGLNSLAGACTSVDRYHFCKSHLTRYIGKLQKKGSDLFVLVAPQSTDHVWGMFRRLPAVGEMILW